MALTIVKDITDGLKSFIPTILTDYTQIDYEYAVEENPTQCEKKFGVIPGDTDLATGPTKFANYNQIFQIILADYFVNQDDDSNQGDVVHQLYEDIHDLLKAIIHQKLGIPTVRNITFLSIAEPEYIEDNTVVVLRTNINVKYDYVL